MSKENTTVFGGSSPTGIEATRLLLQRDHSITLLVRTPSKVPSDISSNPNVKIIQGDIKKYEDILSSITTQTTGVVSVLGPGATPAGAALPVKLATTHIFNALKATHPSSKPRFVFSTTLSFISPADDAPYSWLNVRSYISAFLVGLVKTMIPYAYNEVTGVANAALQEGEGVSWTGVRVAILLNGRGGKGIVAGKKDEIGLLINRKDFATFMVDQVELKAGESEWEGRFPCICSA